MKKILIISFFCLLLNNTLSAQKKDEKETWRDRKFTQEELSKYNGKNGMPVYVAVDGIVYDVTKSKYWKTGKHKNMHDAGMDLTYEIKNQAPKFHKGGKILEKFPKVGVLEVEKSTQTIPSNIEKTTTTTDKKTESKEPSISEKNKNEGKKK